MEVLTGHTHKAPHENRRGRLWLLRGEEMPAKRCSCNSKNPNCCKCDGWGYIEKGIRETPPESKAVISETPPESKAVAFPGKNRNSTVATKLPAVKKPQLQCPHCSRKVSGNAGLKAHIRVKHPDTIDTDLEVCPQCNRKVHKDLLERHIEFTCQRISEAFRKLRSKLISIDRNE